MKRRSGFGWLELIEGILLIALGCYTFACPDRALLDALAAFLYEKETITGEEFMQIVKKSKEAQA